MANKYNDGVIPQSYLDIVGSFDVASSTTDLFDMTILRAETRLGADITGSDTDIYLDDITVFFPNDLPDDGDNPGGIPSATSEWGRVILHFASGEIVLIEGFTIDSPGPSGWAHVAAYSPETGRGIIQTNAVAHFQGEKVYSYVSSATHTLLMRAIQKIESETLALFDFNTGHDHSGSMKGQPIPAAGIKDNAVTESKLFATNGPTNGYVLTSAGAGQFTWADPASLVSGDDDKLKISANDTTDDYLLAKLVGTANKITFAEVNDGGNETLQANIGSHVFDKSVDTTTNITEGAKLFFTNERAQDAVAAALTNSSTVLWTYNDGANTISAAASLSIDELTDVNLGALSDDQILRYVGGVWVNSDELWEDDTYSASLTPSAANYGTLTNVDSVNTTEAVIGFLGTVPAGWYDDYIVNIANNNLTGHIDKWGTFLVSAVSGGPFFIPTNFYDTAAVLGYTLEDHTIGVAGVAKGATSGLGGYFYGSRTGIAVIGEGTGTSAAVITGTASNAVSAFAPPDQYAYHAILDDDSPAPGGGVGFRMQQSLADGITGVEIERLAGDNSIGFFADMDGASSTGARLEVGGANSTGIEVYGSLVDSTGILLQSCALPIDIFQFGATGDREIMAIRGSFTNPFVDTNHEYRIKAYNVGNDVGGAGDRIVHNWYSKGINTVFQGNPVDSTGTYDGLLGIYSAGSDVTYFPEDVDASNVSWNRVGISTLLPKAGFHNNRSTALKATSVIFPNDGSWTIYEAKDETVILVNDARLGSPANECVVMLPDPDICEGRIYCVKVERVFNTLQRIILTSFGSTTIDSFTYVYLWGLGTEQSPYNERLNSVWVQAIGGRWHIILHHHEMDLSVNFTNSETIAGQTQSGSTPGVGDGGISGLSGGGGSPPAGAGGSGPALPIGP